MANSMTGFGRGESNGQGYHFSVEIKSVNHRFLEIMVKTPRSLQIFEDSLRKAIQQRIQRGRIEVYVNLKETGERKRLVKVDKELVLSYDNSLKELAQNLNTVYVTDIYRLAVLPDVFIIEEEEIDFEELWIILKKALDEALDSLTEMRSKEGGRLVEDLLGRLDRLESLINKIADRSPAVVNDYRARLKERLSVLLTDSTVDEVRLAMEVALFADRASITEEIVRFKSHLEQFNKILLSGEPVGRKLDFLVQELNREINTIGSKANDLVISQTVVEGKSELERIREQVQNIE